MVSEKEFRQGLRDIWVRPGMTLEVHSSLSSFGHMESGIEAVIRALQEAVTQGGSIFMPALRLSREMDLSPSDREMGIVTKIKILEPDCERSAMGLIADTFRKMPDVCTGEGVFRTSGWRKNGGKAADGGLRYALEQGGKALLLGVDIYKLTAMHYVEDHLPDKIKAIFAPGPAVNALYPPEEWLIETGAPPVKAWYTIQRMAYEKGFIRDSLIGPCRVMFFDLADIVGLYREELIHHPYKLYGMEG